MTMDIDMILNRYVNDTIFNDQTGYPKRIVSNDVQDLVETIISLRAENGRLRAELEEAQEQWRIFASMMEFEPYDCICLEPPDVDEENEPSAHSQYCPIYLEAYARAMADGTELPE